MRKYVVPQFIDVESKILGPITARQFIIIIITAILIFIIYRLSSFTFFVIQGLGLLIIGSTLAFLKVNGNPFHIFFLNILSSLRKPALRVWDKEIGEEITMSEKDEGEETDIFVPKQSISPTKLSELALIVDTGGIYKGEEEANFINNTPYGKK